MTVDDAKNEAYDLVLAWKQSSIAREFADDAPEDLHAKLVSAEQSITHWMLETMLIEADKKAKLGEWLLADYCQGWADVENGPEAVQRIHDQYELNSKLAEIWASVKGRSQ